MKTNYLLDKKTIFSSSGNKNDHDTTKWVLVAIFVLLFGGGLIYKSLSGVVFSISTPVVNTSESLAHNNLSLLVSLFKDKEELVLENTKLKEQLNQNLVIAVEYKSLQEEIMNLRQFRLPDKENVLVAKVLKNSGAFNYDTLVLDIGSANLSSNIKLSLGQKVIISDNVLLGELVEISETVSKAKLYSTPSRKTKVIIGPKNIDAVAEGRGGGNYLVTLPVGLEFKLGDVVRTIIGDDEYIIGVVEKIEKRPEVPFQKLYIKQPINLYNLSFVAIEL